LSLNISANPGYPQDQHLHILEGTEALILLVIVRRNLGLLNFSQIIAAQIPGTKTLLRPNFLR